MGLSHSKACAYPIPLLAFPLVMGSKEEGELGVELGLRICSSSFLLICVCTCAPRLLGAQPMAGPPLQSPSLLSEGLVQGPIGPLVG